MPNSPEPAAALVAARKFRRPTFIAPPCVLALRDLPSPLLKLSPRSLRLNSYRQYDLLVSCYDNLMRTQGGSVVLRALRILDAVARTEEHASLAAIVQSLGVPKPTVY